MILQRYDNKTKKFHKKEPSGSPKQPALEGEPPFPSLPRMLCVTNGNFRDVTCLPPQLQDRLWTSTVDVDNAKNVPVLVSVLRATAVEMFLWLLGAALLGQATGFYLPGLAPVSFCEEGKQKVPDCKVNMPQLQREAVMSQMQRDALMSRHR